MGTTCCVSAMCRLKKSLGKNKNKAKSYPGSTWLEILGQEKENHGSWLNEIGIQFQWAWKACMVVGVGWGNIGGVDIVDKRRYIRPRSQRVWSS